MKVKFSKSTRYVPEWNDNKKQPSDQMVAVDLAPLRFDDLMLLMDAMGANKMKVDKDTDPNELADQMRATVSITDVVREIGSLIPKYASNLVNLEGDSGPITLDEVVTYPMFLGLANELLMALASISMASETTEGNSEGQPG